MERWNFTILNWSHINFAMVSTLTFGMWLARDEIECKFCVALLEIVQDDWVWSFHCSMKSDTMQTFTKFNDLKNVHFWCLNSNFLQGNRSVPNCLWKICFKFSFMGFDCCWQFKSFKPFKGIEFVVLGYSILLFMRKPLRPNFMLSSLNFRLAYGSFNFITI